jgi:cytidine deaminase
MTPGSPEVDWDALQAAAVGAMEHAYAPYSRFRVGAAVRDAAGRVFVGCNVESASYGLSLCAERVAIFNAIASGGQQPLRALALACLDAEAGACVPCGACRQVMAEHLAADAAIYLAPNEVVRPADLLPRAFTLPTDWPG